MFSGNYIYSDVCRQVLVSTYSALGTEGGTVDICVPVSVCHIGALDSSSSTDRQQAAEALSAYSSRTAEDWLDYWEGEPVTAVFQLQACGE